MSLTIYNTDDDETLSDALTRAVVAETDTSAPPHGAIDLDALNSIFDGRQAGQVTFCYEGLHLTVDSGGEIRIRERGTDE